MKKNFSIRRRLPRSRTFVLGFLILSMCALSGCNLSYRAFYRTFAGIKMKFTWMGPEEIAQDFEKKGVLTDQAFVLDTASYKHAVVEGYKSEMDSVFPEGPLNREDSLAVGVMARNRKDDLQPVHVRYFTADGSPIFKLVNCYLDPPIPMSWNVEGAFDEFPPRPIAELKDVEDDSLSFFLKHIRRLNGSDFAAADLPKADYYAVLFINDYMVRPSRKLLKEVRKYHKQHPDKEVHVLYVNNHNATMWWMMKPETRESVKAQLAEGATASQ
ncbi:MAG: hypothetical protein ABR572_01385 [Cryomorphaceae bacterium]